MKIPAVIQARWNSTRFPGKMLEEIQGKPLLWHVVERVRRATEIDDVYLATPPVIADGLSRDIGKSFGPLKVFTPNVPTADLVGRFYKVAQLVNADAIVRVCADNPCIEPEEIDRLVRLYRATRDSYKTLWCNTHDFVRLNGGEWTGYPDGAGAEIYSTEILEKMHAKIQHPMFREHPHLLFFRHQMVCGPLCPADCRADDLRLDVDTKQDLRFIRCIYNELYPTNPQFHLRDVVAYAGRTARCVQSV